MRTKRLQKYLFIFLFLFGFSLIAHGGTTFSKELISENIEWSERIKLDQDSSFITTWKTNNPGSSDSTSITIPTHPSRIYNYDVDWDNDGVFDEFGIDTTVTHNFGVPGTYTIRIRGDYKDLFFNNGGDKEKIIDVVQWGNIPWERMKSGFHGCKNLNISATDVPDLSNVTDFTNLFFGCEVLNSSLEYWDVSNVTSFYFTFGNCSNFNQPLNSWDVSSAINMQRMFIGCTTFNQALDQWDVSNVNSFGAMFQNCNNFNQPLSTWDMSSAKFIGQMFANAKSFNQDIGNWNTSEVILMHTMFDGATVFNQDIGGWDVSKVTNFKNVFHRANAFNQNINNWDVSQATNMSRMFSGASNFNQPLDLWNVSNVETMVYMFFYANHFNQAIGGWDVSSVTSMQNMFKGPDMVFNQDIGDWDVSSVTGMQSMFEHNPSFDQNIGNWNVSNVMTMERMFNQSQLSTDNYDNLLIGWNELDLQDSVKFHGGYSIYCAGYAAHANLIALDGWEIIDAGAEENPPIVNCKNITIHLDENGTAEISADMLDDGSYDACTPVSFDTTTTTFDCNAIGTHQNSLIVTDENGNTDSCSATVTVLDTPFNFTCPPNITVASNRMNCSAQVTWAEPQATCLISFSSSTNSGAVFSFGTTEVSYYITDAFANIDTCTFYITVTSDLEMELLNIVNPDCLDAQNGAASIGPTGGTSPYLYDWSFDGIGDFDDNQNSTNLTIGKHYLSVKDSLGCVVHDSLELQPTQLNISNCPEDISIVANHMDCSALVTWDSPIENCSGVALTSNYESGVKFDLGTTLVKYSAINILEDTATCSFNVTVQSNLTSNINHIVSPHCFGSADGEISITTTGGEAPYNINWEQDFLEDNFTVSDLDEGIYSFQISDKNDCTLESSIELSQPTALTLSTQLTNASSPPSNEIDLTVLGGTLPYLFDWNLDGVGDFDDSEDLSTTLGGTFLVTVRDANGCTESLEIVANSVELECVEDLFKIFPNPNEGDFTIILDDCVGKAEIEIFDLLGRKIYQKSFADNALFFELKPLSSGTYFLRAYTEFGAFVEPIEVINR